MNSFSHNEYSKMSPVQRCYFVGELIERNFMQKARPSQIPGWYENPDVTTHFFQGGRGVGKSWCGAKVLQIEALKRPNLRVAILGPTFNASVGTCMHNLGTGVYESLPDKNLAKYNDVKNTLTFINGSQIRCFSSEKRSDMRGPEFHLAWIDEVADLAHGMDCWRILRPAVRLPSPDGTPTRMFITGTPRPVPLVKELITRAESGDSSIGVSRGGTKENYKNLDAGTIEELERQYAGTRFYEQEIEGKLLMEAENAMWNSDTVYNSRIPWRDIDFDRIAIGVDPAVSSDKNADETGIILAAEKGGIAYILGDYSVRASPLKWARNVMDIARRFEAGSLVYERNLAGPLINDVLNKTLNEMNVPVRLIPINAKGKKQVRHEPIAALYEAGRVKHMGNPTEPMGCLDKLESQMVTWEPTLTSSPDRIDALSLVVRHLLIQKGRTSIFIAE